MDALDGIVRTFFCSTKAEPELISPKKFDEFVNSILTFPEKYRVLSLVTFQRIVATGLKFMKLNMVQQEQFWDSLTVCKC